MTNNNATVTETQAANEAALSKKELMELLHELEGVTTQCRLLADTFALIGLCYEKGLEPIGQPSSVPAEDLREKTRRAQTIIERLWGYAFSLSE